ERRLSAWTDFRLSGLERFAAPATVAGIRIGDLETAGIQAVTVIHDGPADLAGAERIDQNSDSEHFDQGIVRSLFIEDHGVLHAGASTLLDVNAQIFASVFGVLADQMPDLIRGVFSDADDGLSWCSGAHALV